MGNEEEDNCLEGEERNCVADEMEGFDEEVLLDSEEMGAAVGTVDGDGDVNLSSPSFF